MNHGSLSRFQPRFESLEDRTTPSTLLPFKESLTLVGADPAAGTFSYSGTATHLGKVSVVQTLNPDFDPTEAPGPDNVFATYLKTAANGDTLTGQIIPDDPADPFTTGDVTVEDGTGRFDGATGVSEYVVSAGKKGTTNVDINGTISYDAGGTGGQASRPFRGSAEGVVTGLIAPTPEHPFGGLTATWTGHSTHLGAFTRTEVLYYTNAAQTEFEGEFVFTAANGDQLFATFSGQFVPGSEPGVLLGEGSYEFTGGTGRFADASGTADFTVVAVIADGQITATVEFDGSIAY